MIMNFDLSYLYLSATCNRSHFDSLGEFGLYAENFMEPLFCDDACYMLMVNNAPKLLVL